MSGATDRPAVTRPRLGARGSAPRLGAPGVGWIGRRAGRVYDATAWSRARSR